MKPFTNPLPRPPPSAHNRPFDPWNSSSTGHQRREAPRSVTDGVSDTGWRDSRNRKLNQQFRPQAPPGQQTRDEGQQGGKSPQKSVVEMLIKPGSMKESLSSTGVSSTAEDGVDATALATSAASLTRAPSNTNTQIFKDLVIYVNGSTFPLVSDHKLKSMLCAHGARMSLHLARRQVTHVILGRPAGRAANIQPSSRGTTSDPSASPSSAQAVVHSAPFASARGGCGGGLSGTKMDREVRRIGGCGIKYVGVEWALESIKAGKRLPEARFSNLKIAAQGQASVYALSKKPS